LIFQLCSASAAHYAKMSEIFHPVFDWWQALLAISHDFEKFLSMLENHLMWQMIAPFYNSVNGGS